MQRSREANANWGKVARGGVLCTRLRGSSLPAIGHAHFCLSRQQLDVSAEVKHGCPSHMWISNTRWWKRTMWSAIKCYNTTQSCAQINIKLKGRLRIDHWMFPSPKFWIFVWKKVIKLSYNIYKFKMTARETHICIIRLKSFTGILPFVNFLMWLGTNPGLHCIACVFYHAALYTVRNLICN